jgi:hypothetical protein
VTVHGSAVETTPIKSRSCRLLRRDLSRRYGEGQTGLGSARPHRNGARIRSRGQELSQPPVLPAVPPASSMWITRALGMRSIRRLGRVEVTSPPPATARLRVMGVLPVDSQSRHPGLGKR